MRGITGREGNLQRVILRGLDWVLVSEEGEKEIIETNEWSNIEMGWVIT